MSSKVIREDLVVPYKHTPAKPRAEISGVVAQSLPMAAMFMRNKLLSWSSLFLAIQSFLNEPTNKPETEDSAQQQPPLLRVVFAVIALVTCYIEFIFPNAKKAPIGKVSETVSSTIASTIATATSTATK